MCHFGLLNKHFSSISGHIDFNLKLDVFHSVVPINRNQRTNGPVNAHLRSAAYTNKHV